jgi:hypothetical protein
MSDETTFEIGDLSFRLRPLKLKQSLKAEAILAEAVLPGILAAATLKSHGVDSAALRMMIGGLDRLGELVDIFAAVCDSQRGGAWVRLATFLDDVFERKNAALLAWLAACVEWQFSDFFDGTGQQLLTLAVSRFTFLADATGESGE